MAASTEGTSVNKLTAPQRKQLLTDLQTEVQKFIDTEKRRLKMERDFLQSVLDSSVDAVSDHADEDLYDVAFADVEKFLGVTLQPPVSNEQ